MILMNLGNIYVIYAQCVMLVVVVVVVGRGPSVSLENIVQQKKEVSSNIPK